MAKFLTFGTIAPTLPVSLGSFWTRPTDELEVCLKLGAWLAVRWGAEQAISLFIAAVKVCTVFTCVPRMKLQLGHCAVGLISGALHPVRAGVIHHQQAQAPPGCCGHEDSPVTNICSPVVLCVLKDHLEKIFQNVLGSDTGGEEGRELLMVLLRICG